MSKLIIGLVWVVALIGAAAGTAQAQNLITDGGFETPAVPVGGFTTFALGKTFSKWLVTGEPGNVAIVSGTFTSSGFTFSAHSGKQWLSLNGSTETPTGVQQTVTTTPGSINELTFWVGNIFDPGGTFGTSSTVNVFVNGQLLTSAINTSGSGKTTQD